MNSADYLRRLQAQLKGFAPDEQAQLIEEIAAHIEDGEHDPRLGQNATGRLEQELGSPDDLGRRLRQVHRPGRWLDFLLVVLPSALIFPLLPLFANWIMGHGIQNVMAVEQTNSLMWVSIRLSLIIHAGLLIVSRWKASPGVLIYWMTSTVLAVVSMLLSEIRWPWLPVDYAGADMISRAEGIFWLAVLSLLLVWLARLVSAQRAEPLLVVLAVTPFLFAAANYAASLTLLFNHIQQLDAMLPVIGWFGLYRIVEFIWPALFFLPRQRNLRWAGLMLLPLTYLAYNSWPYRAYPLVISLYLLPAALVAVAWARDARSRLLPTTH